jgi:DNA polymerase III subunit chi
VTQVVFHVGIEDRLDYACRLIRKALGAGARVLVLADEELIVPLDEALWLHDPTSFVPHALAGSPQAQSGQCAVLLAHDTTHIEGSWPVLINMRRELPEVPPHCEKLIELVSGDDADLNEARHRWKSYSQQGFAPTKHDVPKRAGA